MTPSRDWLKSASAVGYWIMNRRPDSPETGHFLRARYARARDGVKMRAPLLAA